MLFSLVILSMVSSSQPEVSWYDSFSDRFEFCVADHFRSPICPDIGNRVEVSGELVSNKLDSASLLRAYELYNSGENPEQWLKSIGVGSERPNDIDKKLWAHAEWLYGKILFDSKRYELAETLYQSANSELNRHPLFFQERAWLAYFRKDFGFSLGHILSSESPLLVKVPFPKKHFLRGLINLETCRYRRAIAGIERARRELKALLQSPPKSPWIESCRENPELELVCPYIENWHKQHLTKEVREAERDLDILELELAERQPNKKTASRTESKVEWPFINEHWLDELGRLFVEVKDQC